MSRARPHTPRAAARALLLIAAVVALSGCSWIHRRNAAVGCREPQITTKIDSLAPLRVPEGLDAPDTQGGVHIPTLTDPERVRDKKEPCLSLPPSYGTPVATPGGLPPQPVRGARPGGPTGPAGPSTLPPAPGNTAPAPN